MGDIDFDELDKAVSALGVKTANISDSSDEVDDKLVNNIEPKAKTTPDNEMDQSTAPQSVVSSSQTPALASQRSSGRFMDMIHPSADMRSSKINKSQTATSIEPKLQPVKVDSNLSMSDIREIANPVPVVPDVSILDANSFSPSGDKPLENPFIANAKVEKRPLGGFSQVQADSPSVELSPSGELEEKVESTDSKVMNFGLQEELKSDILQIESGNEPPTIKTDVIKDKKPEPKIEEPTATPYIIQQYKETKKDDMEPTPIYDVNVYNKPISPDKQKKAGWLWLIWIFGLIILGVGSGVLAYFYILPLF